MVIPKAIAPDLKAILDAQSPQDFESLRLMGIYYHLVYSLRAKGRLYLILGGLTLWFSILTLVGAFLPTVFSTVQALLGVLVVGQSLFVMRRFSGRSYLALAILLLLSGLWNIFLGFYSSDPLGIDIFVRVIGLYQVWEAYQSYKSYKTFSMLPTPMPMPEFVQRYVSIWEGVAQSTSSPELMTIQIDDSRYNLNWILLPDHAVLAHKPQKVLLVVSKQDLVIVPENPKAIDKDKVAIFAQIEEQYSIGKIHRSGFQEYMAWKGITDPKAEVNNNLARTCQLIKLNRWLSMLIPILGVLTIVLTILVVIRYA